MRILWASKCVGVQTLRQVLPVGRHVLAAGRAGSPPRGRPRAGQKEEMSPFHALVNLLGLCTELLISPTANPREAAKCYCHQPPLRASSTFSHSYQCSRSYPDSTRPPL
jgi:hypothetical protein